MSLFFRFYVWILSGRPSHTSSAPISGESNTILLLMDFSGANSISYWGGHGYVWTPKQVPLQVSQMFLVPISTFIRGQPKGISIEDEEIKLAKSPLTGR